MELRSPLCVVRTYRAEDATSLAKHGNNRRIWENLRDRFPHPFTRANGVEYITHVLQNPDTPSFAIDVAGQAVGGISLHLGNDIERISAELGYWLGEEFWGRGIMTEVVTAVTDFCFDNFPLRRISAEVFANNPASARVLEKAGFTFEGCLKNNVLKDGELLDSLLYARTK